MSDYVKTLLFIWLGVVGLILVLINSPARGNDIDYSWGPGTGIMHEARVETNKKRYVSVMILAIEEELKWQGEKIHELEHEVRDLKKAIKKGQK